MIIIYLKFSALKELLHLATVLITIKNMIPILLQEYNM